MHLAADQRRAQEMRKKQGRRGRKRDSDLLCVRDRSRACLKPSLPNVISVAAMTHRGAVRPRNEDAVAVGNELLVGDMEAPRAFRITGSAHVIMLADGMGGHARGELASRTALTMLMSRPTCNNLISWGDALQEANESLYDLMAERPDVRGLGTTIVGVVFSPSSLIVFNVGDSRAY